MRGDGLGNARIPDKTVGIQLPFRGTELQIAQPNQQFEVFPNRHISCAMDAL